MSRLTGQNNINEVRTKNVNTTKKNNSSNVNNKPSRLTEKMKADEQNQSESEKKRVVFRSSRKGAKDLQISAKVNKEIYSLFTKINEANGLSNNSSLNLLINNYVRDKKYLLDEEY